MKRWFQLSFMLPLEGWEDSYEYYLVEETRCVDP